MIASTSSTSVTPEAESTMARKAQRRTPAQIAADLAQRQRQRFEAVNLPAELAELITGADIEVTRAGEERDKQRVQEDSARRLDAFSALKEGMQKGCYDAARQYEHQILVRRGENDRGPSAERVNRTAGFTTDAMVDAAIWLEAINARLAPRDWWLLSELISPSVGNPTWREAVAYITGETHTHGQGAAVRSMTVNLRDAIEAHEKAPNEAAKRAA